MSRKKLLDLTKRAARAAQRAGAKDVRAKAYRAREVELEWRDGKLDRIRESTTQNLSLALYVDGRYSGNSTSDLREDALDTWAAELVATTRYLAEDEHRKLPPPERYEGMFDGDLGLFDPNVPNITPDDRLKRVALLEEAARSGKGADRIVSVDSGVSDDESESVCFATNGLEAKEHSSSAWAWVTVAARDEDDRKPSGTGYAGGRFVTDIISEKNLGQEALARALAQMGSRQVPTGDYEVIIENRAAPSLFSHLIGPLSGGSIQQKRSFMEGRLKKEVGSKLLTVTDDPLLPRGLASTAWDKEGMATRKRVLFDRGAPQFYYLDTYYASKLGLEPTTGGTSNLVWGLGDRSAEEMIAKMDKGLYVVGFLGGNSNGTTGDFSLGIKGFYVEKGEIKHPVSEMNMAGNHLELWKNLVEVGSDPWRYSSYRTPALRFSKIRCSGAG